MEQPTTPLSQPQKIRLGLTFFIGLGLCGTAAWQTSRQRTEQVHGFIVAKEWERYHMSNVEAPRVQQASLLSVIYVHVPANSRHLVPSTFTIWVANRQAVRAITVDSTQWNKLSCGQRYSYSYIH